jgi:hypothetical protein
MPFIWGVTCYFGLVTTRTIRFESGRELGVPRPPHIEQGCECEDQFDEDLMHELTEAPHRKYVIASMASRFQPTYL